MKTYRDILKWGDKSDLSLDEGTKKLIQDSLGIKKDVFDQVYLSGDNPVKIEKPSQISVEIQKEISLIVGQENCSVEVEERALHAYGKSYPELLKMRMGELSNPPDMVIYPRTEEEIVAIMSICNKNKIAITPFGGQSSVTGALDTLKGGVSLDLTRYFNQVISVNETDMTCTVQTGMFGPAYEEYLNNYGQKYSCGHFPQSFEYSTVGGWVAAKGAGQASTGYGKIEDMVLSLKAITPAGIVETKTYPASAQGWDVYPMFIGSEGSLGVITQVTMKIQKFKPQNTQYASFIFKDFPSAVKAMRTCMQEGIGKPHLFRISDPEETEVAFKTKGFENTWSDKVLKALGYKWGQRCLMFVAVEGEKNHAKNVVSSIKKIAKTNGAFSIGSMPTKKWLEQRYSSAYMREPMMDLGVVTDTVETAVMWSDLIPLWIAVRAYLKKREKTVVMVHISHVYENGANLYFTFLSPAKKGKDMEDYIAYHKGLINTIIKNKGSLSHHHGVGKILAPWMRQQLGEESMQLMQAIKQHLDPNGIMNPGNNLGLKD